MENEFYDELVSLINKHSKENGSNTPDFILAMYLEDCLKAFDRALTARTKWWYGPEVEKVVNSVLSGEPTPTAERINDYESVVAEKNEAVDLLNECYSGMEAYPDKLRSKIDALLAKIGGTSGK
jgi:uncharacterized coiled-coil protein SlyX